MRTNQRSVEVPRLLLKDPAAAVTPSAVTAELQANLPLSAPPPPCTVGAVPTGLGISWGVRPLFI